MDSRAILTDAASRPVDAASQVLDGLSPDALHTLPEGRHNSIAWLLWHAARQADAQLAALNGEDEVWASGDWAARLGVDRGAGDFGFGDGVDAVRALTVSDPDALLDYLAATMDAVATHAGGLTDDDLDEVVDMRWTPHVTHGVRLVSIIDDAAVHVGQAAYVRGLLEGWSIGY